MSCIIKGDFWEFFHAAAGLMIVRLCLVILGEDALGCVTNKHTSE